MDTSDATVDSRDFQRIERALAYLEQHWNRHPSLDDIASHVGLSRFHFNRLFHRWAGLSPKAYLQYLTGAVAKAALSQRQPLLEASIQLGLSGPGRLHDLMVNLEAMSPAEYARGGAGVTIDWGVADSPFGALLVGRTARGICQLEFLDGQGARAAEQLLRRAWPAAQLRADEPMARTLARRLWPGTRAAAVADKPLTLRVRGTNFQLKVWQALLGIEPGQRTSYGALARQLQLPAASRAVGNAVGANPVAWLIPCHRVLRGGGQLGGYHWGTDRKRAMLVWEQLQRRPAGVRQPPPPMAAPIFGSSARL